MTRHDSNDRELLAPLVRAGEVVGREPLADARARHHAARAELPLEAMKMSRGEPVIDTVYAGAGVAAGNPYLPQEETV
jgi:nicotinate phosphoribosyltransferase